MISICDLCKKEFKDFKKELKTSFCPDCRKNRREEVELLKKEAATLRREQQKEYWTSHPEEYQNFLAERKAKRDKTKIQKYGSLENAEKARKQKQLETLKLKYPDEDWEHITNVAQLSVAKKAIRDAATKKDPEFYKDRQLRAQQTKIQKYGSLENAYNAMIEHSRQTNLKKYGVENYAKTEESKRRHKQTSLERYGVEHPNQSLVIKEKTRKTCLEKYGTISYTQTDEFKQKAKQTSLEKYGVEYPNQSEEVRSRLRKTNLEKYGVENYTQTDECKRKARETCLRKYGAETYTQTDEFKERQRRTCLEKYGSISYTQTDEFKQKAKQTCLKRYGVENVSQRGDHKELMNLAVLRDVSSFEEENNCTHLSRLVEKYGQGWLSLDLPRLFFKRYSFISNIYIPQIEEYFRVGSTSVSHAEKDVLAFIRSIYVGEIIENTRLVINPLELDIYIPEKKLAVEFNGDFWHSIDAIKKDYHENKSKLCEEKGIRLIHIYECEWRYDQEKLKSLLRIALGVGYSKIGARQCEVREITNKEAKPFNNKNHLQKHRNAQVTYGLFYNNELQQLMSFSQTKYNRNLKNDNEWEIIRGCPGSNNQIIGGVSKLFKAFIRDYNPNSVFSYCDFNKFDGRGYEALGMKFIGYTGPDKFYVDKSGCKISRNPNRRKELEESCMYTIYGAGSKKYLWCKDGKSKSN